VLAFNFASLFVGGRWAASVVFLLCPFARVLLAASCLLLALRRPRRSTARQPSTLQPSSGAAVRHASAPIKHEFLPFFYSSVAVKHKKKIIQNYKEKKVNAIRKGNGNGKRENLGKT